MIMRVARPRNRIQGAIRAHKATLLSALTLVLVLPSAVLGMDLDRKIAFHILAQDLASALIDFSKQTDLQVIVSDDLTGEITQGVSGERAIRQALSQLLEPAGLKYQVAGATSITVGKKPKPAAAESSATGAGHSTSFIRFAQATRSSESSLSTDSQSESTGLAGVANKSAPQEGQRGDSLEEVIVTAQKREQRLQDVPTAVTAISPDSLTKSSQVRIRDYFSKVPGLNFTTDGDLGVTYLSMRGISTSQYNNPSVGIIVDDLPFGSVTETGGGAFVPDLDPGDLRRVEVLRGPQGTLYGANSLGGLIKYVTIDPDTRATSGRLQAGASTVHNGGQLGYQLRGSINLPVNETIAVRASGFTRLDPGYIDQPLNDVEGVNKGRAEGGRVSALYRPSDAFSLKLTALLQKDHIYGNPSSYLLPGLGKLANTDAKGTQTLDSKLQSYSININAKLGAVDLTSITGYSVNSKHFFTDLSLGLAEATEQLYGVSNSRRDSPISARKFSQELRFSGQTQLGFDWLVGGFYTRESSYFNSEITARADGTDAIVGNPMSIEALSHYSEYAAFADLTFHVTERLEFQLGGRQSHFPQSFEFNGTGAFYTEYLGVPGPANPEVTVRADVFTYLATAQYKISPRTMAYVRAASGYRVGTINGNASADPMMPALGRPDETQNYEIGLKGAIFDRLLSFDTAIYYIDWKDLPLEVTSEQTGLGYVTNASRAKSQGIELSLELRPTSKLLLAAWVAYNDAALKENFPTDGALFGIAGDRLPFSSRWSGNFSVDQEFPLPTKAAFTGFVGGSLIYVGERKGVFTDSALRQTFPQYTQVDLRGGVRGDQWTGQLYINNLMDKRGVLQGGIGSYPEYGFTFITPRTIGLTLTREF